MAPKTSTPGDNTLLVLSLLASGDKYGYEMISALDERSDHTVPLQEGTLYPILHTLELQRAVTSYQGDSAAGRPRKYYHITKKGLTLLTEKRAAWETYSRAVNAVLACPGTAPA